MNNEQRSHRISVLVIGAGLSGLSTAVFLGTHGTPALVVERHATTSSHPKARGQMPHTMETLRLAGLDAAFRAASPKETGFRIRIAESATGPVLHELVHDTRISCPELSPEGSADVSQSNAERLLADRARALGATLQFSTEVESLDQDEHGVTATLVDLDTGTRHTVEADYAVAADGHRSPIRDMLGIGTHGHGTLSDSVHWLVRADLSEVVGGGQGLYYLQNPRLWGGTGIVCSTDDPNLFVVGAGYDPKLADADLSGEPALEQIRIATGIDKLTARIVDTSTVTASMRVADQFSLGRVHLVGDAAHTMPPQGGQGGNIAIMDGFYLAWKLAAVVRGTATPGLLDSHDVERRPVGELISENQYRNALIRNPSRERSASDPDPIDDPGLLFFGYRHNGAVIPEPGDSGELLEDPMKPTGRPGSRAPHVPLDGPEGPLSTIELFGQGFVLLTGSPAWADAASDVAAETGVALTAHLIGQGHELTGEWTEPYGVTSEGAVLVRPDRFVAWRSRGAGTAADLAHALRVVLDGGPRPRHAA